MFVRVPLPSLLLSPSPSVYSMVMPLPVPRLTIDLLDDFPDDGTRYELLEGMLLVTPAPSYAHQIVATRLTTTLSNALARAAQVVAGGAIQWGKHTQLKPDVLVCPPGFSPKLDWREIRGWWLAVEVLSPSSRLYDREVKRGAYLGLGVEEYWIADPDDCSVEVWSGERANSVRVTDTLTWQPASREGKIVIDLREIFEGICEDTVSSGRG